MIGVLRLVGKQLAIGLAVVLSAITLTFVMVRISGDPTSLILPEDATAVQREALRRELGLDRSLAGQYVAYLGGAVRGDFGRSYFDGDTVSAIILRQSPEHAAARRDLAHARGCGRHPGRRNGGGVARRSARSRRPGDQRDRRLDAVLLAWPADHPDLRGRSRPGCRRTASARSATRCCRPRRGDARLPQPRPPDALLDALRPAGELHHGRRAERNAGEPRHHADAPAQRIVPAVALLALEIGTLFGGAVLTETVFAWPGIGRLAIHSIQRRDFPVVQGFVAYVAIMFVVITVLAESRCGSINPRLRQA